MNQRPTVGIAGLGRMGHPIAANILNAGFPTVVWNRTPDKAADLRDRGARWADSPADLAQSADIVLTSLADPAAVERVYFAPDGLLASAGPDTILVDLSTGSPDMARRIAAAAQERGAAFLDAPVAGSIPAATSGQLGIMVGGDQAAFNRCADVFAAIGKAAYYLGPSGNGATMKLVANGILATLVQALAEGVALGEKAGLVPADIFTVLTASSAAAPVVAAKAAAVSERAYLPAAFTLALMQKDLWLVLSLANELQAPMPATAIAHDMVLAANATGKSALDFSAVALLMEELAGTREP
ncbi:MAG: 3-hydroxyisobutyrate dehydrogenase [Thermomicrobiales bacterium]|jgi:3-hydroxyisobutyrate dehydrogenase-like beta-hydroxyacid dehydrogenase|nr:3-hydroxyisobutyrate dehydrogenase [Thermomicrobiales bacterium]